MITRAIRTGTLLGAVLAAGILHGYQERPRETWQRLDDIFAALGATEGAQIADVGAGDGYFTTRLARLVGQRGQVYAVDVDARALARLRGRLDADGATNVRVVEGATDDPRLPEGAVDGALIINAYHEMDQHQAMLAGLKKALKPQGRLVIVEPISDQSRDLTRPEQTRRHEIAAHFVLEDLRQAGFRIVRFEEEFTRRPGGDIEWIIVASPAPSRPAALPPAAAAETGGEDWLDASLRIDLEAARQLFASGNALFVDVRNREMFETGRIQGAQLVPMVRAGAMAADLAKAGKRVIAYCS